MYDWNFEDKVILMCLCFVLQKLREMEVIDKKRTAQLQKAIEVKQKESATSLPTEEGDCKW